MAETYTIRVMFRGLDARDKLAIREQLAEIPNVDSVAYEPDSDDYNRGDATLYKLTTQYDYNSDEEAQIERDVADRFAGYDVAVRSDDTSTPDIPPIVFILSIVLVTTILLIACPSYFEPVLFLHDDRRGGAASIRARTSSSARRRTSRRASRPFCSLRSRWTIPSSS